MTNDKIITIRIPGEVIKTIKDTTDSVSKFIRDAVDNSLKAAKDVKDSVQVTDAPKQESTEAPQMNSEASYIYAYQNAKVANTQNCEVCGKEILAGSDATIGLATDGKPHFFCTECKK